MGSAVLTLVLAAAGCGAQGGSSAQLLWLTSVIPVPGTDTVLGAGHVQVDQSGDPMEKAVVVSLRR